MLLLHMRGANNGTAPTGVSAPGFAFRAKARNANLQDSQGK